MKGANPAGLTSMVSQHAGPAAPAGASASAGGSGSQSTPTEPGVVSTRLETPVVLNLIIYATQESLLPHLFSPHITCLNESSAHGIKTIVGSDAGRKGSGWLESEVDPELLIHLPVSIFSHHVPVATCSLKRVRISV